jgi:Zn ribbon nucleic-acid-binding protein
MKCPGQDMKYWKEDAIFEANCPKCGTAIEFYKDDTTRKCSKCEHRFVNPKMDFGCASYCQFAEQCLGTMPEEFMGTRQDLLKDKVAVAMKRYYQTDFKSIRQATTAANHAENIGKAEGGNLAVILCAVYLHGTGLDHAQSILHTVGASEPLIMEICGLLENQKNLPEEASLEAKIIHDALTLQQLQDLLRNNPNDSAASPQSTPKLFTEAAHTIAAAFIK